MNTPELSIFLLDGELKSREKHCPFKLFNFNPETQDLSEVDEGRLSLHERLFLLINSPGGEERDMRVVMKAISKIKSRGGELHAYGTATVQSAGAYIWAAANHRYAIAQSNFMWHTGIAESVKERDRRYLRNIFRTAEPDHRTQILETLDQNVDGRSELRHTGLELFKAGVAHQGFSSSMAMRDHFYEISGFIPKAECDGVGSPIEYFWEEIAGRPNRGAYPFAGAGAQLFGGMRKRFECLRKSFYVDEFTVGGELENVLDFPQSLSSC